MIFSRCGIFVEARNHPNFVFSLTKLIIITEILKTDSLPEKTELVDGVIGFNWHISTKYYTADVLLCATRERTIGDREFADAVEAFVVCFDADQVCSLTHM